jgi:hypothetical protein
MGMVCDSLVFWFVLRCEHRRGDQIYYEHLVLFHNFNMFIGQKYVLKKSNQS